MKPLATMSLMPKKAKITENQSEQGNLMAKSQFDALIFGLRQNKMKKDEAEQSKRDTLLMAQISSKVTQGYSFSTPKIVDYQILPDNFDDTRTDTAQSFQPLVEITVEGASNAIIEIPNIPDNQPSSYEASIKSEEDELDESPTEMPKVGFENAMKRAKAKMESIGKIGQAKQLKTKPTHPIDLRLTKESSHASTFPRIFSDDVKPNPEILCTETVDIEANATVAVTAPRSASAGSPKKVFLQLLEAHLEIPGEPSVEVLTVVKTGQIYVIADRRSSISSRATSAGKAFSRKSSLHRSPSIKSIGKVTSAKNLQPDTSIGSDILLNADSEKEGFIYDEEDVKSNLLNISSEFASMSDPAVSGEPIASEEASDETPSKKIFELEFNPILQSKPIIPAIAPKKPLVQRPVAAAPEDAVQTKEPTLSRRAQIIENSRFAKLNWKKLRGHFIRANVLRFLNNDHGKNSLQKWMFQKPDAYLKYEDVISSKPRQLYRQQRKRIHGDDFVHHPPTPRFEIGKHVSEEIKVTEDTSEPPKDFQNMLAELIHSAMATNGIHLYNTFDYPENSPGGKNLFNMVHCLERRMIGMTIFERVKYPTYDDVGPPLDITGTPILDSGPSDYERVKSDLRSELEVVSKIIEGNKLPVPSNLRRRGVIYARLHQFDLASADLEKAIRFGNHVLFRPVQF